MTNWIKDPAKLAALKRSKALKAKGHAKALKRSQANAPTRRAHGRQSTTRKG